MYSLVEDRDVVNTWMERYGVRFGIYKNGTFREQLFPFDAIPRVISAKDWLRLEKGLKQRVEALNLFLADIYGPCHILKNGIVPGDFVFSSRGYLPQCRGITPPFGVAAHIAGIDLVQAEDGSWFVLKDNLRLPSGASYPMIARTITKRVNPETFSINDVADNSDYPQMLESIMDLMNGGRGLNVILTPGRYNSSFFEHSYLAERMGATLAFPGDLMVDGNELYYRGLFKKRLRVGAVYRRIPDEDLDPLIFQPDSLLGVPGIMHVYAAGNTAIINAPGNGVADDKGVYYFVPKMIRYYLGEEPILQNAPTYLPYYAKDRGYILKNLQKLVIRDVRGAGGYGTMFGRDFTVGKLGELKRLIRQDPRRWIAQEVINFRELECLGGQETVMRKAALRAFVLSGSDTVVWKSGLTRFSGKENSFMVSSAQGGGFKDTWVLNS